MLRPVATAVVLDADVLALSDVLTKREGDHNQLEAVSQTSSESRAVGLTFRTRRVIRFRIVEWNRFSRGAAARAAFSGFRIGEQDDAIRRVG